MESPYLTIWTEPRKTIRQIVDRDPHYRVIFLVVLGAEVSALGSLMIKPPVVLQTGTETLTQLDHIWWLAQIAMLLASPPLAVLSLYLGAVMMRWAGGVLGGIANAAEVRAAMAWATIPGTVAAALYTVALTAGIVKFQVEPPGFGALQALSQQVGIFQIVCLVLGVWGAVVWLKCIGEVHGFSAWKALGASMLAFAISVASVIAMAIAITVAAVIFMH